MNVIGRIVDVMTYSVVQVQKIIDPYRNIFMELKPLTNMYPGLKWPATALSAYYIYDTYCILSLKDGDRTVTYTPRNMDSFENWLRAHKIRRVKVDEI